MSTGGIFQLITNDGKQDRMLMATDLLRSRLANVVVLRKTQGKPDPTPMLTDIERTHILFVNAHFKPFAAIGYEYQSSRPTGSVTLGATGVQFSIPQFGDFIYDMVIYVELSNIRATEGVTPTQGDVGFPANVAGQHYHRLVDQNGNSLASGVPRRNWVVMCDQPGSRFLKKVKFEVNSNPLGEYTSDVNAVHRETNVSTNHRTGWDRAVGQEVPVTGYEGYASEQVGAGRPDHTASGGTIRAPNVVSKVARKQVKVVDGLQTPKVTHENIRMWMPLLFWFNSDPRLSIPSVAIPHGQRYITVDIATLNEIAAVVPSTFIETSAVPAVLPTGMTTALQNRTRPFLLDNSILENVTVNQMLLYTNNIFVNPEVHDIYIKRIAFNLVRVHRIHTQNLTKLTDDIQLNQLKWPIETLYFFMRPVRNQVAPTIAAVDNDSKWLQSEIAGDTMRWWNKFGLARDYTSAPTGHCVVSLDATGTQLAKFNCNNTSKYTVVSPVAERFTLSAHAIPIYNDISEQFFNQYIPLRHGSHFISCPEDRSLYMLTFNLHPGSYQPSGHLNVSRAREFFLKYTTPVGATMPGSGSDASPPRFGDLSVQLVVIAVAINFLLISDGSAVLRYST
jgi:hypothetical protein